MEHNIFQQNNNSLLVGYNCKWQSFSLSINHIFSSWDYSSPMHQATKMGVLWINTFNFILYKNNAYHKTNHKETTMCYSPSAL